MKFSDRIVIPCTGAFKERFERALSRVAQKHVEVPNQAEMGRRLIAAWVDSVLSVPVVAPHPGLGAGALMEDRR